MTVTKSAIIGLILILSIEVQGQGSLPLVAEHLSFLGRITGFYLNEETAFISTAEGGMYVYDLRDLERPELIGRQRNLIVGQITEWNGLLAASVSGGVTLIDISDLQNLRTVGSFGGGGNVSACAVGDTLGFLSYLELDYVDIHRDPYIYSGFEIYNLSDFRRPSRLYGEYYDSHGAGRDMGFRSMLYHQGYLYTEFWNGGVIGIWDVRNPTSPEPVNGLAAYGYVRRVIDRDRLFAFDSDEIHAYSLEDNPVSPEEILHIEGIRVKGGDVEDTLLYTTGWEDSTLTVTDISDPGQPEAIGELNVGLPMDGGIMVRRDRGIATSSSNALLLDLSDPSTPSISAMIGRGEGSIRKSWKYDDLLLTLVVDQGLFISDCSNPEQPAVISRLHLNSAWGLAKQGSYVYVAVVETGIIIVDIENPRQPQVVGQFQPGIGNLFSAAISRDVLYVAAYNGVKVYDLSHPDAPELVRTLTNATTYNLEIADSVLICQHLGTASLYLLRDPLAPRFIQPYHPILRGGDRILSMAAVGGKLFLHRYWQETIEGDILDAGSMVDIVDITRSDTARLLGTLAPPIDGFLLSTKLLFKAENCLGMIRNDSLYKYNFSNYPRGSYRILDSFQLQHNSIGPVFVDGDYLYNSTPGGIRIYDARPLEIPGEHAVSPGEFVLQPPFPNPFNSSVTITFSVGQVSKPVKLAIYDLQGRLVADLLTGKMPVPRSGEHNVVWDASGLGSGVYFLRLEAGEKSQTTKFMLIR